MSGWCASTQLWLAARGLLIDRGGELFRLLAAAKQGSDAETIHNLRVAARRLSEGLLLFSPCFSERHLSPLRSRLQRLIRTLGTLRNIDEARHFFTLLGRELPGTASAASASMVRTLDQRRKEERRALQRRLQALHPPALRLRFEQTCNTPRIFNNKRIDPLHPMADFLKTAVTTRELQLAELYPPACEFGNFVAQHRLRIALKRLRYAMEYCVVAASTGYAELYAETRIFHDLLGQLHDLEVFSDLAAALLPESSALFPIQGAIARRRAAHFAEFRRQDAHTPVPSLAPRLRSLL